MHIMVAPAHILYEDNHLLGVVKPVNVPVQGDRSGDPDLLSLLKGYLAEAHGKPGSAYLGLVHRLDRPAGGVMVFAKTSKAAARLSRQFAEHTAQKIYLAVVRGEVPGPLLLEDRLLKDEATGMVRVSPEGKIARLASEPLARAGGLTLMRVTLFTGRPHQIRVQHAHAGFPLWGDNRYGGGRPGEQLALWSRALTIEHPTAKTPVTLSAPPPFSGVWANFPGVCF